uniref:Uncharacterized protein n=1 Tax=Avena sativa TaxID=4498 RepID=A0ACD5ZFL7_AVESA
MEGLGARRGGADGETGGVAWETTEAEATAEFQPIVGREKYMGKSVEFVQLDDSKGVHPTDTINEHHLSKEQHSSEVPSRTRKRALKGTLVEQPAKKLTHRIRQKRTKEVKALLGKPDHEIDRMKLSVMHLRFLQEARERNENRTTPSGPSSSNQSNSQFGDIDDFDPFGENHDIDRTENHILDNETKLNYHSYMNKQTRAKWSKSDNDLFYKGLQQFGSDFAMMQQLFPDKSRDQVRQKFKGYPSLKLRKRSIQYNMYIKQVIKQLNIEDLQRDMSSTHKHDVPSNEGDTGNESMLHESIGDGENGSYLSDKELGTQRSDVKEGAHVSAKSDDDLDDVFDWY